MVSSIAQLLIPLGAIITGSWGSPFPQNSVSNPTYQPPTSGGLRAKVDLRGHNAAAIPKIVENTDAGNYQLVANQKNEPSLGEYLDFENVDHPQPIRGSKGGTDPGPSNPIYDKINSDKLAPPNTDHGQTINAQWPLGLSHSKLGLDGAGWSRQQNNVVMPDAKQMAGVDMRLEPNAYRELHWHLAGEWALMLNGSVRIQAMDEDGHSFVDDLVKGDVWFFPRGVPHSIQALEGGAEFLLVFDDGAFSEDNTFLVSELFAHSPKSVLSKNLGISTSELQNIPEGELFIFPGTEAPKDIEKQNITSSAGILNNTGSYSYHWSQQQPMQVAGGTVKVLDPLTFPSAANFSAALVTIKPGAMREMHWHTTSDEWSFVLQGKARATLFTPPDLATTFDYRPGDVAYFPQSNTHYLENVGDEDVIFLEVLRADRFSDISVGQWLALTPSQIVADTLHLSQETLSKLKKEKQYVVPGPALST